MTNSPLNASYLGGMVGSALGDAIGELAFQYPERNKLSAVIEGTAELRYTDDTAMAIGLAMSLLNKGCLKEHDLGETFRRNFEQEPWRGYAMGPPTIFSMVRSMNITFAEAAQSLFDGSGSYGNGAAMRIAPLGLFFYDSSEMYELACTSAGVTHAHPIGKDGAAVQACAVARAVGLSVNEEFHPQVFVRQLIEFARTSEIRAKLMLVERLLNEDVPPAVAAKQLGQTVAVQESMPFAIYSFLRYPSSFEDCLCCAIMHGGDRDTLGAMAGAVSGTYLGIEAIPRTWRNKLENREIIESLAVSLAEESLRRRKNLGGR